MVNINRWNTCVLFSKVRYSMVKYILLMEMQRCNCISLRGFAISTLFDRGFFFRMYGNDYLEKHPIMIRTLELLTYSLTDCLTLSVLPFSSEFWSSPYISLHFPASLPSFPLVVFFSFSQLLLHVLWAKSALLFLYFPFVAFLLWSSFSFKIFTLAYLVGKIYWTWNPSWNNGCEIFPVIGKMSPNQKLHIMNVLWFIFHLQPSSSGQVSVFF